MKHRSKIPNREEEQRFLDTVEKMNPVDADIYWLMGHRGLRIGEIVSDHREGDHFIVGPWGAAYRHWKSNLPGLQIEDLTDSGVHVKGKKGHDNFINLPPDRVSRLRHHGGKRSKGLIFKDVASHADPVGTMDHRTKRYGCESGIEDWQYLHPHAFRHAFGYKAARQTKGDVFKVRDLCRHKGIAMSSRYVHEMPLEERKAILETLDEA